MHEMIPSSGLTIEPLPSPLRRLGLPLAWRVGDCSLELSAGPATDLFIDPAGGAPLLSAPALVGEVGGDFLFSARVRPELASTFDAAVLLVYRSETSWAKLCLERSPQGDPTVVSVVTRGVSDDCNSFPVAGGEVELRIARLGDCFAFHASSGDGFWRLVRYFTLDGEGAVEIGFLAQSPTGEGCRASFEQIAFEERRLGDLRNGE
jgi:regulation of enolase protein 1 (concanavalin A-like superfamily)